MERYLIVAILVFAAYHWGASARPVVSPPTFTIKVMDQPPTGEHTNVRV